MTSRERWTVYPLLFLSLGMGLRSRLTGTVQCENLVIASRDGKPVARLHATADHRGQLEFITPDGKVTLVEGTSPDGQSGMLEMFGVDGRPLVAIGVNMFGGGLTAWRRDHKLLIAVGHEEQGPAIFAINPRTDQRAVVPFLPVVRKPPATAEPQPSAPAKPDAEKSPQPPTSSP